MYLIFVRLYRRYVDTNNVDVCLVSSGANALVACRYSNNTILLYCQVTTSMHAQCAMMSTHVLTRRFKPITKRKSSTA